jgi:hypothetical protein
MARGFGASHGIGTNTNVLLAGGDLFPEERREQLVRGTAEALVRTAVVEEGLANWPMTADDCGELVGWDGQIRLQWCHGGAGVVASAAGYLDEKRTANERWFDRARAFAAMRSARSSDGAKSAAAIRSGRPTWAWRSSRGLPRHPSPGARRRYLGLANLPSPGYSGRA